MFDDLPGADGYSDHDHENIKIKIFTDPVKLDPDSELYLEIESNLRELLHTVLKRVAHIKNFDSSLMGFLSKDLTSMMKIPLVIFRIEIQHSPITFDREFLVAVKVDQSTIDIFEKRSGLELLNLLDDVFGKNK